MFAAGVVAGVLVGLPCGAAALLYFILAVPRVLGKIFQAHPKG